MNNPMYNAILTWSLTQTDGLSETPLEPMSEERKEFLEKAMDGMVVDEFKRMQIILKVIGMPTDVQQLRGIMEQLSQLDNYQVDEKQQVSDIALVRMIKTRKEMSLFELDDICGVIDNSNDLCNRKLSGFPVLLSQLSSPFLSVRWRAANAISTVVQNNAHCQNIATEAGAVPALLGLLDLEQGADASALPEGFLENPDEGKEPRSIVHEEDEDQDEVEDRKELALKVVTKAVLALSSLLRHNEPACKVFVESKGLDRLQALFSSSNKRLLKKVVILLQYFWQFPEHLDSGGAALPILIRFMGDDRDIVLRERALEAVLALVAAPSNLQLISPGAALHVDLLATVQRRLKICVGYTDPDDVDRASDERAYLERLSTLLR
jgi:hypothetical protein